MFHNSNVFGSCIIHILYTGVLKFKKKFRRQQVNRVFSLQLWYQDSFNSKTDLKKTGYDSGWIEMAQDRAHCQDLIQLLGAVPKQ